MKPELDQITFNSRSGALGVARRTNMLELDFPSNPPVPLTDIDEIAEVGNALAAVPSEVLHAYTTVAVFETEAQVAGLKPDFAAGAELQQPWLITTAPADASEYDFVSRFFCTNRRNK